MTATAPWQRFTAEGGEDECCFAPEVARQLHMIAVEEDTTLQAIMAEAFNAVFAKRGRPPIA